MRPQILRSQLSPLIQSMDHFPDRIFYEGCPDVLTQPLFAVVGTRNPTPYGLRAAHYFSRCLVRAGYGVVSGLALGIDAIAHRAALSEPGGIAVAVVAHGLDQIYPRQNAVLAREIVARGGAIVTEYADGIAPLRHHFPQRNRIISGLSTAVLIVEAAERSGSLITARWALEQGKSVFVVPGPFDSPTFYGSHQLIREGAILVQSIDDIAAEIPLLPGLALPEAGRDWEMWRQYFLRRGGQASLTELVDWSAMSVEAVMSHIEAAVAAGWVEPLGLQNWIWVEGYEIPGKNAADPDPDLDPDLDQDHRVMKIESVS